MKIRFTLIYSLILGLLLCTACHEDDDVEAGKNMLPPGPEYVKEGNYCLNVVYYIRKGLDTLDNWHSIYSSYLKTLQSEYRAQMTRCGYKDKTFNLEVNKQNPAYIHILRLEGQNDTARTSQEVITEVMDYLNLHPEKKSGFFTVIFTPGMSLSTSAWNLMDDNNEMTASGLISAYTPASLNNGGVGTLMMTFGKMCFLAYNTEPFTHVYYSMMNQTNGPSYWGISTRLLPADAMWLNQNQIFNDKEKSYYTDSPEVNVTHSDFKFENDEVVVNCEFNSLQNVVGVVVYNDPWSYADREDDILDNGYTIRDAVPYATDEVNKSGSNYKISVRIPWNDLAVTYKVPKSGELYCEAEIRFRFLIEDGLAVPMENKGDIKSGFRYPYKIKDYVPDFLDQVDTDIEEPDGEE